MLSFWSCVPAITVSLSQDRHNTAALHWMRLRSAPPASRSQSLMVLSNEPDASRGPLDARHHTQPRWVLMVPRPARVCISLPLGPSRRSHRFTFLSLEPEAHIASSPPSRRTQFTSAMWPEGRMMCSKGEEVLDDSIRWGLSEAFWDWTCRFSSPAPAAPFKSSSSCISTKFSLFTPPAASSCLSAWFSCPAQQPISCSISKHAPDQSKSSLGPTGNDAAGPESFWARSCHAKRSSPSFPNVWHTWTQKSSKSSRGVFWKKWILPCSIKLIKSESKTFIMLQNICPFELSINQRIFKLNVSQFPQKQLFWTLIIFTVLLYLLSNKCSLDEQKIFKIIKKYIINPKLSNQWKHKNYCLSY